jgi:hypothetical protein
MNSEEGYTPTCELRLPNGHVINNLTTFMNMTTTINITNPDLVDSHAILNFTSISFRRNDTHFNYKSSECAISFCIRHYNTTVTKGTLRERGTVVSHKAGEWKDHGTIGEKPKYQIILEPESCFVNGTEKLPPYTLDSGCVYHLNKSDYNAVRSTLGPLLNGKAYTGHHEKWDNDAAKWKPDTVRSIFRGVPRAVKNLQRFITDDIRGSAYVCPDDAIGDVYITEPFIAVTWRWMALPVFTVVSSVFLLSAIIICTMRENIWKSSPVAILFAGHEQKNEEIEKLLSLAPNVDYIHEASENLAASLGSDGKLVVQDYRAGKR